MRPQDLTGKAPASPVEPSHAGGPAPGLPADPLLSAFADVTRLVCRSLDPAEVAQQIVESVCALLGTQHAALYRIEPDSQDLVTVAFAGDAGPAIGRRLVMPRGTGVCGFAARERRLVSTQDLLADPRFTFTADFRARIEQAPYRAVLAAPLLAGDEVVGVVSTGDRPGRAFGATDVRGFQAFAGQAAIALRNALLYEEATRRLGHTETLLAVSRSIGSTLDLTETMRRVAQEIARALGADSAGACLLDPQGRLLRPLAGYHIPKHMLERLREIAIAVEGSRLVQEAFQRRRTVVSADSAADPRAERETILSFPVRSLLFVPLVSRDRPLGGLFAAWWGRPADLSPERLRLADAIGAQAAVAIDNARLFEEERRARDALSASEESIRRLSEILAAPHLSFGEKTSALLALGRRRFRLEIGVFCRVRGDGVEVIEVAAPGSGMRPGARLALAETFCSETVRAGDLVSVEHAGASPEWRARPSYAATGYEAYLGAPIVVGGEVYGTLGFSSRTPRAAPFPEAEKELLRLMARWVGGEVGRQRAAEELDAVARRLVEVQEHERRRIARELHDEIGQVLTGLKLTLEMATRLPGDVARSSLEEATAMVQDLMARVRDLSLDLRPAMLDDLGLVPAMVWHLDRYGAQTGVRVSFEQSGLDRRFSPDVETAAYRIVQEALTNVARHAGVGEATVRIQADERALRLEIEDRGRGFALGAARTAGGLAGMRERATLLAGRLTVASTPGLGTRVTAVLPLSRPLRPAEA